MISATAWIRKGAAKAVPSRFEMTEEQYTEIMSRAKFEIDDAKHKLAQQRENRMETLEGDLEQYKLAESDEEEEQKKTVFDLLEGVEEMVLEEEDSYLDRRVAVAAEEEEDLDDLDDLHIKPTDDLLLACRTEDQISYLEVYVYEREDNNLYVHHDIMLPNFPLCVEWVGCPLGRGVDGDSKNAITTPTGLGNFAAVGTLDPEIEIWDLDVLEVAYPSLILGQSSGGDAMMGGPSIGKKKGKKSLQASATPAKGTLKRECHTDSVMSLSWSPLHQNLLLSGSADSTIMLWDLSTARALRSFDMHQDKVQAVQWNPRESSWLASAAYDRKTLAFDCRIPGDALSWDLPTDPECIRWNPHDSKCFAVSDEAGHVHVFDMRRGSHSKPLLSLAAHSKAVTMFDWNPALSNCLLTASADKTVKVWDTRGEQFACIASRKLDTGKIFTASFCPDVPSLVCAAGSKGILTVMDLAQDEAIMQGFELASSIPKENADDNLH